MFLPGSHEDDISGCHLFCAFTVSTLRLAFNDEYLVLDVIMKMERDRAFWLKFEEPHCIVLGTIFFRDEPAQGAAGRTGKTWFFCRYFVSMLYFHEHTLWKKAALSRRGLDIIERTNKIILKGRRRFI